MISDIISRINELSIIPVVKIEDVNNALPLANALKAGGLPIAEITFRTQAAEEIIRAISNGAPDMLVGAGTVLTADQAEKAASAGAKFIISPSLNPEVVTYCVSNGLTVIPGVSTPNDIEVALGLGLTVVKFFPAEAFGGLTTLKAMSAPYGGMRFIPTGGISIDNLNDYLSFDRVIACGGSWMVKADLIAAGKFDIISDLAKDAIRTMLGFDLAHIGINSVDADEALNIAKKIATIFGLSLKEGNSSNFVGSGIEVNKSNGFGQHGHIAIKTNHITRAIPYLERKGVKVDMSTAKGPVGGPPISVYLKDEIGGFAVHLLQTM